MALLKNFTDASGVAHTPAHWRCVQINIGAADRNIALTFYGYLSLEAFGTGKQPLLGAKKDYTITGSEFLGIAMAAPVGANLYDVLAHAAETYALAKKDTDSGEREQITTPVLERKTETVQVPVTDIHGDPVLDGDGNPATQEITRFVTGEDGNPVMVPVLDADGKPVVRVTQGSPIMVSFFEGAEQV